MRKKLTSPSKAYTDEQYSSFPHSERALLLARSFVGLVEEPNNTGPMVEEFIRFGKGAKHSPWCGFFVNYCIEKSVLPGDPSPLASLSLRGSTYYWLKWAKANKKLIDYPVRGCIMIRVNPITRTGHMGFVTRVNGDTITTIEGNTNRIGGREGVGVMSLTRKRQDWQYIMPY